MPNASLSLSLAAARYRLGLLPSEEFPAIAMAALEAGFDGAALCSLSCGPLPHHWEINSVFERALLDCSVAIPTTDDAVELVLRNYIQAIASGSISPRDGMCRVIGDLYRPHISKKPDKKYVGDQRDLHELIGGFYSYDDIEERPDDMSFEGVHGLAAIPMLDQHLRQLANEWLLKHGDAGLGH